MGHIPYIWGLFGFSLDTKQKTVYLSEINEDWWKHMHTEFDEDDFIWKKSSYCGKNNCLEVMETPGFTHVRDEKGYTLSFTSDEWDAFIKGVKEGEFD